MNIKLKQAAEKYMNENSIYVPDKQSEGMLCDAFMAGSEWKSLQTKNNVPTISAEEIFQKHYKDNLGMLSEENVIQAMEEYRNQSSPVTPVRSAEEVFKKNFVVACMAHDKCTEQEAIESFNSDIRGDNQIKKTVYDSMEEYANQFKGTTPAVQDTEDDEIWKDVTKKWGATHTIEKVMGTHVELDDLNDNESVCFGDGKTYHFKLTKK